IRDLGAKAAAVAEIVGNLLAQVMHGDDKAPKTIVFELRQDRLEDRTLSNLEHRLRCVGRKRAQAASDTTGHQHDQIWLSPRGKEIIECNEADDTLFFVD